MKIFILITASLLMAGCGNESNTTKPSDVSITLTPVSTDNIGSHAIQYTIKNLGDSTSIPISANISIAYLDAFDPYDGYAASVTPISVKSYPPGAEIGELASCIFDKYGRWKVSMDIVDLSNATNNHSEYEILIQDPNHTENESILGIWNIRIQYSDATPIETDSWNFNIEYNSQHRLTTTGHDGFEYFVTIVKTNAVYFMLSNKTDNSVMFSGEISPTDGTISGQETGFPTSQFIISRPAG